MPRRTDFKNIRKMILIPEVTVTNISGQRKGIYLPKDLEINAGRKVGILLIIYEE